jgi:hypothetical protein
MNEPGGDAAAVGGEDGEGRQRHGDGADQQGVAPRQPAACGHHGAAHQRRRRHAAGAHQRHQGEHQRDQQAERPGDGQRLGIERHPRAHRQHLGDQRLGEEGQRGADREADRDAQQRKCCELDEIGRQDQPLRRAQAFHDGDGPQAPGQKARDGIADAHAADQQRGEADQADELGQPVEPEADAAARLGKPPDPPAGIGKAALERVDGGDIGRAGRKAQPVLPVQQAAGLDEARFGHRVEGNHEPRAQAREGIQPAVGLAGDDATHLDRDVAHSHAIAGGEVHALECGLLDHRAPHAVALGQRVGERPAALQLDRAIERIGRLDRLELDQGRPSV